MGSESETSDVRLFRTLQLVIDWLKFGETKNAALMTLNGAAIVGMHSVAQIYEPLIELGSLWLWWATICCLISIFICLSSFYARTKFEAFHLARDSEAGSGVIFFGHLAGINKHDLVQRLVPNANPADFEYLDDMAGQIIVNAKLAKKKMALFNIALLITMAGALTPIGIILYYWRFCDNAD
ncbi:MAG: DUF5706 domain-containing protein [Hyphomicrobiales bacterium]